MILSWMLTAIVFGLWVALAAVAAQVFVCAFGRQARWIWCAALAVSSLWPPLWVLAALTMPSLSAFASSMPAIAVLPDALLVHSPGSALELLGRIALVVWAVASSLLAYRLVRSLVFVRRLRGSAEPRLLDGHRVLVTDGLGPATIGLLRHDVLVPRELLTLEEPLRRLVLRHEREHCLAGNHGSCSVPRSPLCCSRGIRRSGSSRAGCISRSRWTATRACSPRAPIRYATAGCSS